MKKINKPSKEIQLLLNSQDNAENLKEWIKLLTAPFKNKMFVENPYNLASVFHKGTEELLSLDYGNLVRIDFPSTVTGLYFKTDQNYNDEGCLILSVNNRASLSFLSNNHSVVKYRKQFASNRKEMSGSYAKIARTYLIYLKELMAVPKPPF